MAADFGQSVQARDRFAAQMFDRAADLRDSVVPHIMIRPGATDQSRPTLIFEALRKDM